MKRLFVNKFFHPVPGVNAHNFSPANAQEAISSQRIEPWKSLNRAAHAHFVEKGTRENFFGISELVRAAMDRGVLVGRGVEEWRTRDDSSPAHQHDRKFDYHWPKPRRTRSLERRLAILEHDPLF